MREKVEQLLGIEPGDVSVLRLLAFTFAVAAAAAIIIATVTKSLFLSNNALERLPWVYMGSGVFTAVAALVYVQAAQRLDDLKRSRGLFGLAIGSLVFLRLLFPLHEQTMSLIIFVWVPSMGHLVIVQSWNMAATMLPTRQVKRLAPVLAGLATIGAAVGGATTRLLLNASFIGAEDMMLVAAGLLAIPFFRIGRVLGTLKENLPETVEEVEAGDRSRSSEIGRGFRSIAKTPLLARLAGFVFLMQVASILIDFQFSGELKKHFDKDAMAAFLGGFYWLSNVIVLFVSFFATSRIVRWLGIGVALAGVAVLLAVGSVVYLLAATTGFTSAFYVMAAIAFGERIGQFAMTRTAVQMLVTPLDAKKAERAKTLIDGVIYRGATVLVSVVLLVAAPSFDRLHVLSPAVIVAGAVVLWIGLRIGPHYRKALLDGLRARRIDTAVAEYRRLGLGRQVVDDVEQRINQAETPDQLRKALVVAMELRCPVGASTLERLAVHEDAAVASRALAKMAEQHVVPTKALMLELLQPERPAEVLRAALDRLGDQHAPGVIEAAIALDGHPDLGVAAMASALRQKVYGDAPRNAKQTDEMSIALEADLMSSSPNIRARAIRITGSFDFSGIRGRMASKLAETGLPRMLDDPDPRVRQEAVEAMGQLQLEAFVEPLVAALDRGELRPSAINALSRYGESAVGPISAQIRGGKLSLMQRKTLINVLERMDDPPTTLLMSQARSRDAAIRDHGILALWRLTRDKGSKTRPPEPWLKEGAAREIQLLHRYKEVEAKLGSPSFRAEFFNAELIAARARAERRAFLLLGMIYNRSAIYRAYTHYRSPARRTRSNAIELLDQHVTDKELRPFVRLADTDSTSTIPPIGFPPPGEDAVANLLGEDNPWLLRVWRWSGASGDEPAKDGDIDLVVLLKSVSMFSEMSGEPLLPVAAIVKPSEHQAGEIIVREGEHGTQMFLVVRGTLEVLRGSQRVATIGARDAFGELAILDGAPRSATVRTGEPGAQRTIEGADFEEQLDLHPDLGLGIVRMLSKRLRQQGAQA